MKSDAYYIAELEDKILERVYEGTKNIPRPWGLILSGGFDSGLLAALTKPDYIYSVSFPYGPKYDEGIYRDAIIKHLGLKDVTVLEFTKDKFMHNLQQGVKIMGEPVSHFSLAPFNALMRNISSNRLAPVNVLSGEGPDEYLGGYARQIIFDELKKLFEIPELHNYHKMVNRVVGNELVTKYCELLGYNVTPELIREMLKKYPMQGVIGKLDMVCGVIEKMEQKLAKVHVVNLHYPYIEESFAEYCYSLPDHLKIRDGVTKWAFRQVCKKYLPEMMMDRSKMGGPVAPIGKWLEEENEFAKEKYIKLQEEILNEK